MQAEQSKQLQPAVTNRNVSGGKIYLIKIKGLPMANASINRQ